MSDRQEPKDNKQSSEVKDTDSHKCGFCGINFLTFRDLYGHQRKEHDPDGIMFSEIGHPN